MDFDTKIIGVIFAIIIGVIVVICFKQSLNDPNSAMYSKMKDLNKIEFF